MSKKSAALMIIFLLPLNAYSDGKPNLGGSANYRKSDKLIPGEEVVTPAGRTMKVWSTTGPVPVSDAPEPFNKGKTVDINDLDVVVPAPAVGRPVPRAPRDTFDVRR